MRFVFIADIHLHNFPECSSVNDSGLNSRFVDGLNVLKECFEYAIQSEVEHVFIGGDLFHDRRSIAVECLAATHALFNDYAKRVKIIAYPGNHCRSTRSPKSHSLSILKGTGTVIVDRPLVLRVRDIRVAIIPYMWNRVELVRALKTARNADVVMMHQGVQGVESRSGFVLQGEPLKKSDLPKEPLIVSGHIHEHQWITDNFVYSGSPLQLDWGDAGEEKGFLDIDASSGCEPEVTFVPTTSPKFVNLPVSKRAELNGQVKGNFVRLLCKNDRELRKANKLEKRLELLGANSVSPPALTMVDECEEDDVTSVKSLSVESILEAYVDSNVHGVKSRTVLKKLGRELLLEAGG